MRFRQRRKRLAFCLAVRGFVRLLEQQALALHALDQGFGPLRVAHLAVAIPEIEFGQVPMQVSLAHAVELAIHTTLEQGEEALSGVRSREAALADILVLGMVHGRMTGKLTADLGVDRAFVRHQVALAVRGLDDQRAHLLRRHVGDVERTGFTVALNQRDHGHLLRGRAIGFVAGFATDIRFVGFDNLVLAA